MKTYVITLSQRFPATHPKKGEPTYFKEQVEIALGKYAAVQILDENGRYIEGILNPKYHTLRGNYDRWYKIFEQIYAGEASLSLRVWSGKPYRSKMIEIARLTKDDGIGLQALEFLEFDPAFKDGIWIAGKTYNQSMKQELAKNDGLTFDDWNAWFFGKKKNGKPLYDLTQTMAIIHFTSFRY